jgi:uncharacterized protein
MCRCKLRVVRDRFIIIHGWGGNPDEGWFPWLKRELEGRGAEVEVPAMPDSMNPTMDAWVGHIRSIVPSPDEHTHLIGHSLGVQTSLRFAAGLGGDQTIGTIIGVAGFFSLYPHETIDPAWDSDRVLGPWIRTPLDDASVRSHTKKIIAFFSDNDNWVPHLENAKAFQERLGAETHILHSRGHFSGENGCTAIEELLPVIDRIIG